MICDLAETYRIYDWRQVPIKLLGIYAAGLRWDSRVMMERMGEDFSLDTDLDTVLDENDLEGFSPDDLSADLSLDDDEL